MDGGRRCPVAIVDWQRQAAASHRAGNEDERSGAFARGRPSSAFGTTVSAMRLPTKGAHAAIHAPSLLQWGEGIGHRGAFKRPPPDLPGVARASARAVKWWSLADQTWASPPQWPRRHACTKAHDAQETAPRRSFHHRSRRRCCWQGLKSGRARSKLALSRLCMARYREVQAEMPGTRVQAENRDFRRHRGRQGTPKATKQSAKPRSK